MKFKAMMKEVRKARKEQQKFIVEIKEINNEGESETLLNQIYQNLKANSGNYEARSTILSL